MQEKMILATYISNKHGAEYEWGVNDCNTFVFEFHDQAYGTNLMSMCKYRDKRAAMKFSKGYLTLNQWMHGHWKSGLCGIGSQGRRIAQSCRSL